MYLPFKQQCSVGFFMSKKYISISYTSRWLTQMHTLALLFRIDESANSLPNISLFVIHFLLVYTFQVTQEINSLYIDIFNKISPKKQIKKLPFKHNAVFAFLCEKQTNLYKFPSPKLGINKSSYSPAPGEVCRACRAIRPSKAVMLWAIKASGPLLRMEASYFVDTFFTGKIKDSRAATVKKAT